MTGSSQRPRLGQMLLQSGVITEEQLATALRDQAAWGGRIGLSLLGLGYIDERDLVATIAAQLRLPVVELDLAPPPPEVLKLLPIALVERHGVIPIGLDGAARKIRVACSDPTRNEAFREVQQVTGLAPEVSVATPTAIEAATRRWYYGESVPRVAPDPRLNVSRGAIRDPSDDLLQRRLGAIEDRLERLVDLAEKDVDEG